MVPILALLVATALTFLLGAIKTYKIGAAMFDDASDPQLLVAFIGVADTFLVGTALFVFAASLYDLFIGTLALPEWMIAHDLNELKSKLGSVLILLMAGTFVEHLVAWENAGSTLLFALAIGIVSATLIAFGRNAKKDKPDETPDAET